jgi:hypothetical protein
MSSVGRREIQTQKRVLAFFRDALGYGYLGHWKDRLDNSNIEEARLTDWLKRQGHSDKIIGKVLFELGKAAALGGSRTLYDANREVYDLLSYGAGRAGAEAVHRLRDRGYPPEPRQPEEGLHPALLHHGAARHGRQRERRVLALTYRCLANPQVK